MENSHSCECNCKVKVGQKVANFEAQALLPNGEFGQVSLQDNIDSGKWTIVFFWPLDFTFVCPTEIRSMSENYETFVKEGAEIFGVSTDSIHAHRAWTNLSVENGGIGKINFPMLGDTTLEISRLFDVCIDNEGIALRGVFIISPEGILQSATINNLDIGRNTDEIVRVLQALKSGGLCPMNWKKGDQTL